MSRQRYLSTREGPILPHGCAMSSPLTRCTCNATQVNGILSHTIPTEQTCHFSHFTVSAISSFALLISPTPLYFFLGSVVFQKTAFLLFWKDTIAAKIRTEPPGEMRRLWFLYYQSFLLKKQIWESWKYSGPSILESLYIHLHLCDCLVK